MRRFQIITLLAGLLLALAFLLFALGPAGATSISFTPVTIPVSHVGNITLNVTGVGTNFTMSHPTWVITNSVTGTTTVTKVGGVDGTTTATVIVTVGAGVGTFTLSDSQGNSFNGATATPTVSISPSSFSASGSATITGTNTLWATDHPAFTVTGVSDVSIGSISWPSNTSSTATITIGSSGGTVTLTDPSTTKTTTFTVASSLFRRQGSGQRAGTRTAQ